MPGIAKRFNQFLGVETFREIIKLIIFLILLTISCTMISFIRGQDKIYLSADSGISEDTSKETKTSESENFVREYKTFLNDILHFSDGKIAKELLERIYPTFLLSAYVLLFFALPSAFIPLWLNLKQYKTLGKLLEKASMAILSVPVFIFSVFLLILFFRKLNLLPPGGFDGRNPLYLILPGTSLGMRIFARLYILVMQEIRSEEKSNYILFTRSRGISEYRIYFFHIFLKIFPVFLVYLLMEAGSLLSGAVIVEEIFFFPGIGKSMIHSIRNADTTMLRIILFYTGIVFYLFQRITFHISRSLNNRAILGTLI